MSKDYLLPSAFIFFSNLPGKEKITIGPLENGKHITFHFGTKSRHFDIHIKDEKNNSYNTVLKISYYSLKRLFCLMNKDLVVLTRMTFSQFINLGKLRKNNCILQELDQNKMAENFCTTNKNQNRIRLKKSVTDNDLSSLFIDIDSINQKSRGYLVYKVRKSNISFNGFIFSRVDIHSDHSFIYLSKRQIKFLRNSIVKLLLDSSSRINYVIPNELFDLLK